MQISVEEVAMMYFEKALESHRLKQQAIALQQQNEQLKAQISEDNKEEAKDAS